MDIDTLHEHNNHISMLREAIKEIQDEEKRRKLNGIANFAHDRLVFVADGTPIDLWGFGEVPPIFLGGEINNSYWVYLYDLQDILGVSLEDLVEYFDSWTEHKTLQEYVGEIDLGSYKVEVVETAFIFWAFATKSVWKTEFMKNISDLLILTYQQSGSGNDIKVAPVIKREDGTTYVDTSSNMTLSDYVEQEGLPDQEEAVRKAFRGPLGGLLDEQ